MRRSSFIGTNLLVAALAITPVVVWDSGRAHGAPVVAAAATTFHEASTRPAAAPANYDLSYLQMIGHRGGNDWAPENTLAGLAHSFQIGARAVEFDVHFSKDQVPIVLHDETLNRTTTCKGAVEQYTYAQLRGCDSTHGAPVPNIYEALSVVARSHGSVYVHVKQADTDAQAAAIVAAMNRYGLNDGKTATTIADRTSILDRLAKAGSKRCGLIFSNPKYWRANYPVLIPFNTPITRGLVARAQRAGHFVVAVQNRPISVLQVPGLGLNGYMANKLTDALHKLTGPHPAPTRPEPRRESDAKWGTAGA